MRRASAPTRAASDAAMTQARAVPDAASECPDQGRIGCGDDASPSSAAASREQTAQGSGHGFRSTETDKDVSIRGCEQSDRGSGTIWMVALIGLIWSMATMAMAVGGVRAARHRAYAAADLAALAAASHFADGAGSACELAARIARGSGGRLRQCVFHGRISDVVVVSEIRSVPALGHLTATARARAGPVYGMGGIVRTAATAHARASPERVPGSCGPPLPCDTRPPPP